MIWIEPKIGEIYNFLDPEREDIYIVVTKIQSDIIYFRYVDYWDKGEKWLTLDFLRNRYAKAKVNL